MNITLIVFAGKGSRINSEIPKQFIRIKDTEIVVYTIKKFNENPHIDEIILVTSKEFIPYVECFKEKYELGKIVKVVEGGNSRQESVRLALESIDYDKNDNILIHDGARPLVSHAIINTAIEFLSDYQSSCPYIPKSEELKEVSNSGRNILLEGKEVAIQTPQCFKFGLIKEAHLNKTDLEVNDDISLIDPELVKFYPGDKYNFKITTDSDLEYLKAYLENL